MKRTGKMIGGENVRVYVGDGSISDTDHVFPLGYGSGETPASLPTHSLQIS